MPLDRTTNFPNGATNAGPSQTMAAAGVQDPSFAHIFHDDFDIFNATDWTITIIGAGTASLVAGDGGILQLLTSGATTDSLFVQAKTATYTCTLGKDLFFKALVASTDDTLSDIFYAGLMGITTTPLTATNGIWLSKANGIQTWQLNIAVAGVLRTFPFNTISPKMLPGPYMEVGFHQDYLGNIEAFCNPTTGPEWANLGPLSTSTNPVPMTNRGRVAYVPAETAALNIPVGNLAVSFGLQDGNASSHNMQVDYITAVKHR